MKMGMYLCAGKVACPPLAQACIGKNPAMPLYRLNYKWHLHKTANV